MNQVLLQAFSDELQKIAAGRMKPKVIELDVKSNGEYIGGYMRREAFDTLMEVTKNRSAVPKAVEQLRKIERHLSPGQDIIFLPGPKACKSLLKEIPEESHPIAKEFLHDAVLSHEMEHWHQDRRGEIPEMVGDRKKQQFEPGILNVLRLGKAEFKAYLTANKHIDDLTGKILNSVTAPINAFRSTQHAYDQGVLKAMLGMQKRATAKSERLNKAFGLRERRRRTTLGTDEVPVGALTADRTNAAITGDQTPNVAASQTMSPAFGPGGV